MKRHWVRLQLRFEAPKDIKSEMLSRRAALSGNTLYIDIIATFLVVYVKPVVVCSALLICTCSVFCFISISSMYLFS